MRQTNKSLSVAEVLTEWGYNPIEAARLVEDYRELTFAETEDDSPREIANMIDQHHRGGLKAQDEL